jgi:hypothetical protein
MDNARNNFNLPLSKFFFSVQFLSSLLDPSELAILLVADCVKPSTTLQDNNERESD